MGHNFLEVGNADFPGEKRHININYFLWLTSIWPWDKRLIVPGLTGAKKFMCSPQNTGNINFSLWLTGGLSQGCPDFQKVYVFKVYVPFSCFRFISLYRHNRSFPEKTKEEFSSPCNLATHEMEDPFARPPIQI